MSKHLNFIRWVFIKFVEWFISIIEYFLIDGYEKDVVTVIIFSYWIAGSLAIASTITGHINIMFAIFVLYGLYLLYIGYRVLLDAYEDEQEKIVQTLKK